MKIFKTSFLIASAAIITSCGGSAPIISTPIANIDTLPIKVAPLTDEQSKSWMTYDLSRDTIPGMSVDRAYSEILKTNNGQKVIVAVVDSGVDIEHEDLKNVIWTNPKEIAGNGIDDDKNGYIDDIHGWNFLGDIVAENMEYVRYIKALGPKYEGKTESSISATDREEFALYQKAKAEYDKDYSEAVANKERYEQILTQVKASHAVFSKKLGKENYTKEELEAIQNPTEEEQQQIASLNQMLRRGTVPGMIVQLEVE